MSEFPAIAADIAARLRSLELREVVYFHCDHFEPWDFSSQPPEKAAEQVVDFVDSVQEVDFARRLTLFYSNPWGTRLSKDGDLVRAAPEDALGFVRRGDTDHNTLGAPLRYLRTHAEHEIQIHIHHENFTWTRGMRDPERAEYLSREGARALDGARLECAVEQWLQSARREFDYAPTRWFFVHGLWALNGADPEGCNIHDEIARLMKWGCRGDFTFPAGRAHCDPRFEAPYFCRPSLGPKSYDGEDAQAEFAWGNSEAAADRFFIWNSPIKAAAASLDWGDPGLRQKLAEPLRFAREIVDRSFRWDGVLFIKTHAHSMHRMNRREDGRLVYPHCFGPTRDLYSAIFEAAVRAGAAVTFATAGEVYDRFVAAETPAVIPPMSSFRPQLVGKDLRHIEPTSERVLDAAAAVDQLATAALRVRIAELGASESGAEEHYAALAQRGSVLPKYDLRAAQILLSQFGTRCPVHEIGAGIGVLPLLLAALGIPALGIESSERRYEACRALDAEVCRAWAGELAVHDYLLGRFPECVEGEDLSGKVAVITDFTCSMTAAERVQLILALRGYAAVLLDVDRFIDRRSGIEARRALIEELRGLGIDAIYDADISADFAFILIVNDPDILMPVEASAAPATLSASASADGTVTPSPPLAASATPDPGALRIPLLPPFELELGHCWICRLDRGEIGSQTDIADNDATPRRSSLRLYEDGVALGPAHSSHAAIRDAGAGTFSHWKDSLYFSTSDNSDPNRNGRKYEVVTASPEAPSAVADDEATSRAGTAPSASRSLRPAAAAGKRRLFTLADLRHDGGFAVTAKIPVAGDSEQHPHRSSAVVLEDGVVLGPPHSPHAAIRELGEGRYSHWHGDVYFSTGDGSDPRNNGRLYQVFIAGDPGQSAAASHAIEALRRLPQSYTPVEAYTAIEAALAALYPEAVLGDPHKSYWHDAAFVRDYRRVCGVDRRAMERKYTVYQLVKGLRGIDGELAECGTRNGETAYFMALAGREVARERPLHVFDSFEGLSPPTEHDGTFWAAGALAAPEAHLRRNLTEFDVLRIYKGWIPSRFPEVADRRFCFVHLDVDLFEPTRDAVAFFYERLARGGILLCDDYGSVLCPGARKAIDEFFAGKPEYVIDLPTEQGFIIKA